jgi:probable HAF family extracellular repeat protein
MRRFQIAAACGAVLLMSWPCVEVVHTRLPLYTIEDLGTLNGAPLTPRGINAAGHVVGMAEDSAGAHVAFVIDTQAARDLGSLGGTFAEANAINDQDEIAGFSMGSDGVVRAFRYTAAGMQPLAQPEGTASLAYAINATGQIAGYGGSTAYHAFRYTPATGMTDLGTLGGSASYAYGLNVAGQVTGCAWMAGWEAHAFVSDGTGPMQDLSTLGGTQSCGVSINRAGQIAGWSFLGGDLFQHAFRYSLSNGLQDLGTLGGMDSFGAAINDSGTVVGWSTDPNGERRAFVFTDADGLANLNDRLDPGLGWTLTEATGINAGGQIVGVGLLGGERRAFRLTPPPTVTVTPPDLTPPVITSVRPWPPALWPPHGEMMRVRVRVAATDNVDPAPSCRVTSVTSSEPDAGTSKQDRPHDIVVRGDLALSLRAELGPKARERVYTLAVTCADAAGNAAVQQATVRVVKNPWQRYR